MSPTHSQGFAGLTDDNLKQFTSATRQARDRLRGRSSLSTSPDPHGYIDDAPPPVLNDAASGNSVSAARSPPFCKPRSITASELAADEAQYREICAILAAEDPLNYTTHQEPREASNEVDGTNAIFPTEEFFDGEMEYEEEEAWRPSLPNSRPRMPRQWDPQLPTREPTHGEHETLPELPPNFPPYYCTHNMNQTAAYLANASYVAALSGPPVADVMYGILIVPAGEERTVLKNALELLDSKQFFNAVHDARENYAAGARMHVMDKDSAEFTRHRFDEEFRDLEPEEFDNVPVTLPHKEEPVHLEKPVSDTAVPSVHVEGEAEELEGKRVATVQIKTKRRKKHSITPTTDEPTAESSTRHKNPNTAKLRDEVGLIRQATKAARNAVSCRDDASKPHGVVKRRGSPRSTPSKDRSPTPQLGRRSTRIKKQTG
ncbi:hypothetical protein QBC44DRAFT_50275 [Cladorrhinum sp. PSN332]|nr:hypothetical protein QBC44DRAFT_50275 [Cladorrhinum sp. PSN332]